MRSEVSGIRYQVSGIRYLFEIWYMCMHMSDVRCLMPWDVCMCLHEYGIWNQE